VYSQAILQCEHDSRRLFNTISGLLGQAKQNPMPNREPTLLANDFANFFIRKITKIRNDLAEYPLYVPEAIHIDSHLSQFCEMTDEDIRSIVRSSKPTTCQQDPCPTTLIKNNLDIMLPLITKMVNLSFAESCFSKHWKRAVVLPLLKKPGLDLVEGNYRPLSNLTFISKIVEKACLKQFIRHCDQQSLAPGYQSAYKANYSTETALLRTHYNILKAMETKKILAFVSIDLSAAFDTVDHDVLISVLTRRFGVSASALNWFDSYLRPRTFFVSIQGVASDEQDLTFSVPQGSCLGPVLFNCYSSSLQDHIADFHVDLIGYADDHGLSRSFTPQQQQEINTIHHLEDCLSTVHEWMNGNRLKLNPTKTEWIYFGSRVQLLKCQHDSINVSGAAVIRSSCIKLLGVTLDEQLKLKAHISNRCKVALYNFCRIRSIRKYLSVDICKMLASSLILSHLDYANSLLYGLAACDINRLQRVQNLSAKMILGRSKYDSSTQCLKELHWLPVAYRIKFKIVVLVFKCLTGVAPIYLQELIKIKTARTGLRAVANGNCTVLHVPFATNSTFLDRSFAVSGPKLWNELPPTVRNQTTLENFKVNVKTYYFKECF
jgi:hypothetical protein